MILLASSDPEGLCYVETANLDGETNLKVKFCHQSTASFDCAEAFSRAGYFTLECEAPNPRLYSFDGAICCWDFPPTYDSHKTMGLSANRRPHAHGTAAATEVELASAAIDGAGSGWYTSAGQQQEQQQQGGSPQRGKQQRPRSPSRAGSSPQRRRQQPLGGDSLTASLGEYGQQVSSPT